MMILDNFTEVLQAKKNNLVNDITLCCKSLKTAKKYKNIKKL